MCCFADAWSEHGRVGKTWWFSMESCLPKNGLSASPGPPLKSPSEDKYDQTPFPLSVLLGQIRKALDTWAKCPDLIKAGTFWIPITGYHWGSCKVLLFSTFMY